MRLNICKETNILEAFENPEVGTENAFPPEGSSRKYIVSVNPRDFKKTGMCHITAYFYQLGRRGVQNWALDCGTQISTYFYIRRMQNTQFLLSFLPMHHQE